MSKKDLTEIVVILDRSGSMSAIRSDTIGGFNTFIESQKNENIEGNATVTLVQFDDKYELLYSHKPIKEVPLLDVRTFVPRGSTALLDAIGRTLLEVDSGIRLQDESERPNKVMVIILTDGQENASKEFTKTHIVELINEQENKGWKIIYLSADINAFTDAASYGIAQNNTFTFDATGSGTKRAFTTMSNSTSQYRNTYSTDSSGNPNTTI